MKYTKEQLDFLKEHETMPRSELSKLFNAKFSTERTSDAIKQKCIKIDLTCPNNGRFKKGSVPANKGTKGLTKANKTSFKCGLTPINTKKVGSIITRKEKNHFLYMHIKIAKPNKWQTLHLYIWEQKYGKIPKGYCVIFKDKNSLNVRLDNLMLVSRAELVRLNQKYSCIDESLKETALQVIKLQKKVMERKKI